MTILAVNLLLKLSGKLEVHIQIFDVHVFLFPFSICKYNYCKGKWFISLPSLYAVTLSKHKVHAQEITKLTANYATTTTFVSRSQIIIVVPDKIFKECSISKGKLKSYVGILDVVNLNEGCELVYKYHQL